MRLIRDPWRTGSEAEGSSAGRWHTAGSDWSFRRVQGGWRISCNYPHSGKSIPAKQRLAIMKKFGLTHTIFKTRREAVDALELTLAEIGKGNAA